MIWLLCAAFIACINADGDVLVCDDCEFSVGGIGYLPGPNCRQFFQCRKTPSGSIEEVPLCCPNGTVWNQEIKNCDYGHCDEGFEDCPDKTDGEGPCHLWADPDDQKSYFMHPVWIKQTCPPGTVYKQEYCGCVHSEEGDKCYDDPLLHFPFAYDFNDIQCPKAAGLAFGDAEIDTDGGYMRLDGNGDYMTFSYLNNYFENNAPQYFTLSMWIRQTRDGFDNIFNLPEGLFGNGNCHEEKTIFLALSNLTANGGLKADSRAYFEGVSSERWYGPPEVWCHIAISYSQPDGKVTLYLNGHPVGMLEASGPLMGTMSDSSVGLAYISCDPFFFTGCIDDVMVFVREVSDQEIYSCVYGNGRTEGHSEKMYECPSEFR